MPCCKNTTSISSALLCVALRFGTTFGAFFRCLVLSATAAAAVYPGKRLASLGARGGICWDFRSHAYMETDFQTEYVRLLTATDYFV